jgi:hypothetical protein
VTAKSLQAGTLPNMTVNYRYNSAEQLSTMTYPTPASGLLSYGYDAMGRLNSFSVPGLNWVRNVQHDLAGRMNSMQYPAVAGGAYTQETMRTT